MKYGLALGGGTIRKVMGGGGVGKKINPCKGKCQGKKIRAKKMARKKSCRSKSPYLIYKIFQSSY